MTHPQQEQRRMCEIKLEVNGEYEKVMVKLYKTTTIQDIEFLAQKWFPGKRVVVLSIRRY